MPEVLNGDFFLRLLFVLGIDLILSGDNAVVIALAARRLKGPNRRKAILWGTAGAVALRLLFAAVVSYLLWIPFLQVAGGLLLLWIAWKLFHNDGHHDDEGGKVRAGTSTWEAIRIIVLADAVMALDNVIALVGAARGDLLLLAIGIALTIPLVIFGSALLTCLLDRFPALVYAGAGLLVYIAVEMFFADAAAHEYLEPYETLEPLVAVIAVALFLTVAWSQTRRAGRTNESSKTSERPENG